MPSDHDLLERHLADVELRPFTLDEFHRRRHRKERNRRIATAAMGLVLLAAVAGGVAQTIGEDDQTVDAGLLGPRPSPVEGRWTSIDTDGSYQTMEIHRTEGDEHDVVLHDDAATACGGVPATVTGTGRLTSLTQLVLPQPVLTCDDGTAATTPEGVLVQDILENLTFVLDPETGALVDGSGVVWRQGAPGEDPRPAVEGASPFEGSWVVGREGQYFPDSLEIRVIGDDDLHEVVMLKAETPQCAGGPSTMSGTGRRESDVRLTVVVDLTCDDGSGAVPQSPQEEGMLTDLSITFTRDPVTDELVGSLGSLFIRRGAELAQGDPMATVDQLFEAIAAGDAGAFSDLFAPDGGFDARGSFEVSGPSQSILDEPLVRTWMGIQDAWGFEAEVGSCTADPAEPFSFGAATDGWIECEVAARWPTLSMEITERWRFELRGARLVYWGAVPLDLDPSGRALPLGYPGLEDWEAWLEANHAEDADRWLVERQVATAADFPDAEDPEREASLAALVWPVWPGWEVDGHSYLPAGLVPYDPAFADAIAASIQEYLEER